MLNDISILAIKKLGYYEFSCISYGPEDKEHSDIEKMFKSMYEYIPKILDFDLSWHKGATELTVALGAMSQGFKAPEQVDEDDNLTRNTAVDVYSIGMLSYYVLTGKNPMPN